VGTLLDVEIDSEIEFHDLFAIQNPSFFSQGDRGSTIRR
jgi:hypothetical protein